MEKDDEDEEIGVVPGEKTEGEEMPEKEEEEENNTTTEDDDYEVENNNTDQEDDKVDTSETEGASTAGNSAILALLTLPFLPLIHL